MRKNTVKRNLFGIAFVRCHRCRNSELHYFHVNIYNVLKNKDFISVVQCFHVRHAMFGIGYVIVKFTPLNTKSVCNLLGIPSTEDTMNVVILQTGCHSKPGAHLFSADSIGIANEWSSSLNSTNSITNNNGQSGNVSVNNSGKT